MKSVKIKLVRKDYDQFCSIIQAVINIMDVTSREEEAVKTVMEGICSRLVPRRNIWQDSYRISFTPMDWIVMERTVGNVMMNMGDYERCLWYIISKDVDQQFHRGMQMRMFS